MVCHPCLGKNALLIRSIPLCKKTFLYLLLQHEQRTLIRCTGEPKSQGGVECQGEHRPTPVGLSRHHYDGDKARGVEEYEDNCANCGGAIPVWIILDSGHQAATLICISFTQGVGGAQSGNNNFLSGNASDEGDIGAPVETRE